MNQANSTDQLRDLAKLMRYWILRSTSRASSGHPTSALSAVELTAGLFFGGTFRFDPDDPEFVNNDRLIFSKGHASPLLYALWAAAGAVPAGELDRYRSFDSDLEGHPTFRFRFAEAATGSLGQGLSVGLGMALAAKQLDALSYRTYVLLGDSEMAEGSQWEAIQLAAHYQLDNLVGILDVNRLGQRGTTMYGHDLKAYEDRISAFGWETIRIEDGHDFDQVLQGYEAASKVSGRPVMLIAKTVKGKGVSMLADQSGWHGKPLDDEKLQQAIEELGEVDQALRGTIAPPQPAEPPRPEPKSAAALEYTRGDEVATRTAYGNALRRLADQFPELVALDGEVSNSTRSEYFRDAYPDRFFEMFIAEQNMVGTAMGMALRGRVPFVSTFAAFLTRAFDQIRMAPHSDATIHFAGSHAGISIGKDGPSQMGLEDIAMFRTIPGSAVLYPCDAVATERLVEQMAQHRGISYLRTTRGNTPVIYDSREQFPIGGSKVLRRSTADRATIIAAGITVHEALRAAETLQAEDEVAVRVIDLYSIKPIDTTVLHKAVQETGSLITVEDHYLEGGLGDAVLAALAPSAFPVERLAVRSRPRSGKPDELLEAHGISHRAILEAVRKRIASGAPATASAPG